MIFFALFANLACDQGSNFITIAHELHENDVETILMKQLGRKMSTTLLANTIVYLTVIFSFYLLPFVILQGVIFSNIGFIFGIYVFCIYVTQRWLQDTILRGLFGGKGNAIGMVYYLFQLALGLMWLSNFDGLNHQLYEFSVLPFIALCFMG